jgi:hypothetical protein
MKVNKNVYRILIPPVGIVTSIILYRNTYTEFKPIIFQNGSYKNRSIERREEFNEKLKFVLDHYDHPYKIDEQGNILIKRQLSGDEELVWNYTTKALDTAWLKTIDME